MLQHTVRLLLWVIGAISLALGVIGIFLPVMPTAPFVLLAAACWAKASPRLHRMLLEHNHTGPILRAWEERGAIPRTGKWLGTLGMAVSSVGVAIRLSSTPHWWLAALMAVTCTVIAFWMWSRPDA